MTQSCPDCGHPILSQSYCEDTGEPICANCGSAAPFADNSEYADEDDPLS